MSKPLPSHVTNGLCLDAKRFAESERAYEAFSKSSMVAELVPVDVRDIVLDAIMQEQRFLLTSMVQLVKAARS